MSAGPLREAVLIPGPAGKLEVLAETPTAAALRAVSVVCHPHPLHQGTMRNKVVHTLAGASRLRGAASVRFNFRGVGASEGGYGEIAGEVQDALAVADWARRRWPGLPLWLMGFSFGGLVALEAALERSPKVLVTVAPALQRAGGKPRAPDCPWFIVQASDDELIDPGFVSYYIAALESKPQTLVLPDATHFFHGRLIALREAVLGFLDRSAVDGVDA